MDCPRCGNANPRGSRFCGECAEPLIGRASCPNCGSETSPSQKYCRVCGQPLIGVTGLPVAVPSRLADKIRAVGLGLEGERKQVTVLFADVKGSMELAEAMDAEAWHTIIER